MGYTHNNNHRTYIKRKYSTTRKNINNRSKMQMTFIIIMIFVIGSCLTGFAKFNPKDSGHEKYYTSITIKEGDTLWTIAEENKTPEYRNSKEYIKEVCEMNHLTSYNITEGKHLVIPHYTVD